jgi:tetratricopeptide (TPR) repeat protein
VSKLKVPLILLAASLLPISFINEAHAQLGDLSPYVTKSYLRGQYRNRHRRGYVPFPFSVPVPVQPQLPTREQLAFNSWNNGVNLSREGNYQEAVKAFTQTIELGGINGLEIVYQARGMSYWKLGNHQQAIEDYSQSIRLNPQLAMTHSLRGLAYWDLENYQQAIEDYSQSIHLDPQLAISYFGRGKVYWKLGNRQQAIADIQEAASLAEKLSNPRLYQAAQRALATLQK